MGFCATTGYSGVVMAAMVINGAHAGGFSPISVSGNIVNDIAESNGFHINTSGLFVAAYVVNLIVTILTVVVMKALNRLRTVPDPEDFIAGSGPSASGSTPRGTGSTGGSVSGSGQGTAVAVAAPAPALTIRSQMTGQVWLTISLICLMVIGAVGFELPIGFLALACGLVLTFTSLKDSESLVSGISWSTVLLVTGMIIYVSLLTHAGVIDSLSTMAVAMGAPLLVAVVLCYVIGISSAFASSTALLTALIPLSIPLLEQSDLSATAVMAALAVSATIVDVSPFSTDGALIIANTQGKEAKTIWRDLMIYAGFVVLSAPLLSWALLVPTGIM